ncbi:MAG: hypothetical protein ABI383_00705 [Acidobacteriaceae bacterium]
MPSHVSYAWKTPQAARHFRTGVSLHSHTSHSRENLLFIEDIGRRIPLLGRFMEWQRGLAERAGFLVDLSRGYWTPPLTPPLALDLERGQIEEELQLQAIVSLTDHDSIAAPVMLNSPHDGSAVPVSCEWTVPFGGIAFHIGVHNLPPAAAPEIMGQLTSYTAAPTAEMLKDVFSMLHGMDEVLVVFNHPLWNLYRTGQGQFTALLEDFVRLHGEFLHAIELNGLRRWQENCAVSRLASTWRKPLIAGGDRHGCEPNANLNLTNAEDFPAFVREIRVESASHVLFMPQYRQDPRVRCFRTFVDIVRHAPELPLERQRWDQRVFHPNKEGLDGPLERLWTHPPAILEKSFAALCWIESTTAGRKILSNSDRWTKPVPIEFASLWAATAPE